MKLHSSFLKCLHISFLLAFSTSIWADKFSTEWMKHLSGHRAIHTLSIPGTHDSGSTQGGKQLKTQTTSISKQLEQGIRAFDIRLKERNGKLGIYHSHAFQEITWEDNVLPSFIQFLKAHPSEMLIVSLKREGGKAKDYETLLLASLSTTDYQSYFINYHPDLKVNDCRGKILFFHRDYAMKKYPGAACLEWEDNSTCLLTLKSHNGYEGKVLLEDEYQYASKDEYSKKIQSCINNIKKVSQNSTCSSQWGITFISATGLPTGTPKIFADKVNPAIVDWLENKKIKNCGIFFIDFVADSAGRRLVNYLIKSNL